MTFLRADLAQMAAYKSPHPGQADNTPKLDPLDTNESPIDLPDALKEKLAETYRSAIALKQAVITYAIESGKIAPNTIATQNVTLGNGSDELIRSVLMATCLGNNGSILVATPTFSMYGILAKTLGITVYSVSRKDNFEVDIAAAEAKLKKAAESSSTAPIRVVFMVHTN